MWNPFQKPAFEDVCRRQLNLFLADNRSRLDEAYELRSQYDHTRELQDAHLSYGLYDEIAEDLEDGLIAMMEHFASAMGDDKAVEYTEQFKRLARKRFGSVLPGLFDN